MEQKKDSNRKRSPAAWFFRLIVLCCAAGLIIGLTNLWNIEREYSEGNSVYEQLRSEFSPSAGIRRSDPEAAEPSAAEEVPSGDPEDAVPGKTLSGEPEDAAPGSARAAVDFAALQKRNPDTVGWIFCTGTAIDYPIVQGPDNEYYLARLFTGTSNTAGSIFLDYRNSPDFTDRHSILYGHNMKNGSMFASLTSYRDPEYFREHPQFLLCTPEKTYSVKIFSGYSAGVEDEAWRISFDWKGEFADWAAQEKEKSCFESDITPSGTDHIITLSTCSYEFEEARFVVHGILRPVEQ